MRHVADDLALGELATGSGTGIAALLIQAGQVRGTVRVDHALGSALGWDTKVARQAGADGLLVGHATLGIVAAGRGLTGVQGFHGRS